MIALECRRWWVANGGTVTQCYSTGMISGTSGVGGLVGNGTDRAGIRDPMSYCPLISGISGSAGWWGLMATGKWGWDS